MNEITSRERMKIACTNGQPDRVPVAPDISNMIPCRLTGKPFWEIYANENPPLWKAYIDAVRTFDLDGWFIYGDLQYRLKSDISIEKQIVTKNDNRWEVLSVTHTPDGDLTEIMACPVGDSPTLIQKKIKDFEKDFKKIKHLCSDVKGYDPSLFREQKKELGDRGIMCTGVTPPGFPAYIDLFDGNLEALTYAFYDFPDLFEELRELQHKQCIQMTEMAIDAGVDSILTGGSGSLTLQSPAIWREYSLPTLRVITKMCHEAGVISGIHSCGKEMYVVEACANETDLNYINPLEIPPMGDCSLADCKKKVGNRLALMGNLHTTEVMLYGSADKVRLESLKAIRDAGAGGGFILSTGDQCGRDTPFENINAMVKAVKEYGSYPLDIERIDSEIIRLENDCCESTSTIPSKRGE